MAAGVGERFLDDAVGGEVHTRRQLPDLTSQDQAHRRSRRHASDQLVEAVQPRLRATRIARVAMVIVAVRPQHAEQAAQLGHRVAGGRADDLEPLAALLGHAGRGQAGGVGLDGDHGHVVGDDVVQLAGDAGALGQGGLVALGLGDGTPVWSRSAIA